MKDYAIIDLETTGLKPNRDEIIEMSALIIRNGKPEKKAFDKLVKPSTGYVPPDIETLTGITTDMIKDSPKIADVMPEFLDFIGDLPLVGWNVGFDYKFIVNNTDEELTNKVHDLIPDIKKALPDMPNYKLTTVANELGIDTSNAHRAIVDCINTYKVILKAF